MKIFFVFGFAATVIFISCSHSAKLSSSDVVSSMVTDAGKSITPIEPLPEGKNLFIDVHEFGPGKVTYADVMAAHQKDLAIEGKYDVDIIKFWFDQEKGKVYCLAAAKDSNSLIETHRVAHGLVPQHVYPVTSGQEALLNGNNDLFLDVHYLGAGNVTKEAVAGAHEKDLAIEKKYGVNLINYWVDEKEGVVMCLAQAKDSTALINTHREAHGLLPASVSKVKEGQ
jgi:hypothetical protein